MLESKWQWVSNHVGPMGWFTDGEKKLWERSPKFTDGYWRPIADDERERMNRAIGQMAYEQS